MRIKTRKHGCKQTTTTTTFLPHAIEGIPTSSFLAFLQQAVQCGNEGQVHPVSQGRGASPFPDPDKRLYLVASLKLLFQSQELSFPFLEHHLSLPARKLL